MSACLKPSPVCGGGVSFSKLLRESAFWFFCLVFLGVGRVQAEEVLPVFRYALERWPAEEYRAYYVAAEGDDMAELEEIRAWVNGRGANVRLEVLPQGGEKKLPEAAAALQAREGRRAKRGVFFGGGGGSPVYLCWGKGADARAQRLEMEGVWELWGLASSSARERVAKKILGGDSAVFVVVERGNAQKLLACMEVLGKLLGQAEEQVGLGWMKREEKSGERVPVRVGFSEEVVSSKDPLEKLFVGQMLQMKVNAGVAPSYAPPGGKVGGGDDPLVVVVTGRGRAVRVFSGEGISEGDVAGACSYVCGPIRQTEKRANPGEDLIFAVDWEKALGAKGAPNGKEPSGKKAEKKAKKEK